MGDDEDATNMAMVHIQESNNVSTHFLLCNGYNGNALKDTIKKVAFLVEEYLNGSSSFEKLNDCGLISTLATFHS